MGIVLNDFIGSIADKLKQIYPNYDVWFEKIIQEGELKSYFFISVVNINQIKKLGSRYQRTYDFDIFYFQEENKNLDFYSWTEEMLLNFHYLQVGDDLYHVKDIEFEKIDDVGHFTFTVRFDVLEIEEEKNLMEELIIERSDKNG